VLIGIGMDLAEVGHWQKALGDPATSVIEATFTASERAYAQSSSGEAAQHLAARFAAKEAFIKALGATRHGRAPLTPQVDLRAIEVERDAHGRPRLALHGPAQALADQLGVRHIWLSLTHTDGTAGAVVVLEG
jgi:holo-[acyl-carrier protein] synthase